MKLTEINFPVYKLREIPPSTEDNVLFYFYRDKIKVIDDKSVEGDTLARRRLKIDPKNLYTLKHAIFFLGDLLKQATSKQYFIDAVGKHFMLQKTTKALLTYKRIINTTRGIANTLIEVEGHGNKFISLYPPLPEQRYAALLRIAPYCYILYGFSEKRYKDSYRKI